MTTQCSAFLRRPTAGFPYYYYCCYYYYCYYYCYCYCYYYCYCYCYCYCYYCYFYYYYFYYYYYDDYYYYYHYLLPTTYLLLTTYYVLLISKDWTACKTHSTATQNALKIGLLKKTFARKIGFPQKLKMVEALVTNEEDILFIQHSNWGQSFHAPP